MFTSWLPLLFGRRLAANCAADKPLVRLASWAPQTFMRVMRWRTKGALSANHLAAGWRAAHFAHRQATDLNFANEIRLNQLAVPHVFGAGVDECKVGV